MATCRVFGCLRTQASLQRLINASCLVQQQTRCFHKCAYLCGVEPMKLLMPALSPTMEEGTIAKWLKQEGDPIQAGDAICEIETDKSTVAMDADEDGIMAKILVPEGTKGIKIKKLIALMVAEGEDYKDVEIPAEEEEEGAKSERVTDDAAVSEVSEGTPFMSMRHSVGKAGDPLSPAVRQLTEAHGLDPATIQPSGPHGRLLKGDVLRYLESPEAAKVKPVPPMEPTVEDKKPVIVPVTTLTEQFSEDLEISNVRRVIAKRLTESKYHIPHAYTSVECNMNQVQALRKKLQEENIKLSVNDFIIKAAAVTLKEIPEVNASWNGESVQLLPGIDISVAVATDGGLITPIVTNAVARGLIDISNTVKDLASRARDGKLQLHEFQGGSFSISNLGMFGISEFTAVINPPQSCIIAVGTSRLVPSKDSTKPVAMTTVTMSSDARVVDDTLAARFLEAFRKNLENPLRLGIL